MKTTKRIPVLILCLLFCLTLAPTAVFAVSVVASPQVVYVDGAQCGFEVYNIGGNNYFKLRDIAYILSGTGSQFSVNWDASAKMISVSCDTAYEPDGSEMKTGVDNSASAVLSSQSMKIDGTVVNLQPYNIGGNNFFKLRELGAALGFGVDYNVLVNSVIITSTEDTELTSEEIFARCSPAVFYIEVYDEYGTPLASGSGFFIDNSGTAVTNYHVIDGCSSAKVTASDTGEVYEVAGVYNYSPEEDWAVIKVDGKGFSRLPIGASSTVVGGAAIYTLGSPLGLQNSISQGIISNPSRTEGGMSYIQISAAISSGSSGGALINKYGQVIGITTASYVDGQNLNLAVPLSTVDTAVYGKTCTELDQAKIADPLAYLKAYLLESGEAEDITIGESTSKAYYLTMTVEADDYYLVYFPSSEEVVACDYFYGDDSGRTYCSTIYLSDSKVVDAELYYYFDLEAYSDTTTFATGSGYIKAATFCYDDDFSFSQYSGIAMNQTHDEVLGQVMLVDSLDAVQYMFDDNGVPLTIADFGFIEEYAEYWVYAA